MQLLNSNAERCKELALLGKVEAKRRADCVGRKHFNGSVSNYGLALKCQRRRHAYARKTVRIVGRPRNRYKTVRFVGTPARAGTRSNSNLEVAAHDGGGERRAPVQLSVLNV